MKRLILAAAILCIACGDSNDKTETTDTGGDTTGGSTTGGSTTGGSTTGGSTTGGGTSTFNGYAFQLKPTTCSTGAVSGSVSGIIVGVANRDVPNICSAVSSAGACISYANTTTINIVVSRIAISGTAEAVGPGQYDVISVDTANPNPSTLLACLQGPCATVRRDVTDAACLASGVSATSGSVTIDQIAGNSVSGSYSVTFPGSSTPVTGTFSARDCSANVPTTTDACTTTDEDPSGQGFCSAQQTQCL